MIMVGAKRRRMVDCSEMRAGPWLTEQVLREKCFFLSRGLTILGYMNIMRTKWVVREFLFER